jgi:NAD(P)-dependent dehydrogenase (short-subunit alcohol dehydrogenase family)
MLEERDPEPGPKPARDAEEQPYPGTEDRMRPRADHGEETYRGSGRLEGLVAIVTGGDSGIGRAVAIAFAREGADVAIAYLADVEDEDAAGTREWVERAGRRCLVQKLDVRDPAACKELVERVVREMGRLDLLVNNAAYQMSCGSIEELSDEQIDRTFRTNAFACIYMARAAVPHLPEGGVIINTGSITGMRGHPQLIDYAATKGAVHMLTKSLADSLSDRGIRVNCVAPGPVWTPLIPSTFPEEQVREFGKDTIWGRPAQPAEIAPSYVFLASADSRCYTGEIFAPTGEITTR